MHLKIHGVQYNVERAGQGDALVLLHGFTGSAENWRAHISVFEKYFSVVALDFLGHGKSESPSAPLRYRMEWRVADLREILDELEIAAANLLGYSMGGRVALHFANAYPERVTSLILSSASPGIQDSNERQARAASDAELAEKIEREGIENFIEYWTNLPLFATQTRLPESAREKLKQQRLQNNALGLANSLRGLSVGVQAPLWDALPSIRIPTLLIAGQLDEKFSNIARAMANAMPNAELKIVADAGHAIHLEQPEMFDEIVLEYFKRLETRD